MLLPQLINFTAMNPADNLGCYLEPRISDCEVLNHTYEYVLTGAAKFFFFLNLQKQ